LSQGNFDLAFNALLLFLINMFTIVFASILSLWMVGFRSFRKTSEWIIYSGVTVMVAVLVLGIYLSLRTEPHAVTQKLPANLAETIQTELGKNFQLEGVEVVYEDRGVQLNLRVTTATLVPAKRAEDIRLVVAELFDVPVQIRVISRNEAGVELRYHW
jgi:uncharacterized membrane protein